MKKTNDNDMFLAHWLDGRMSDEQLRERVTNEDFVALVKLRDSLSSFQLSQPDMERNYAAIKQKKIDALDKTSKVVAIYRFVAVAAVLLLFFGLYQAFVFSNHATTGFGQSATITLADHSSVTLNAKSSLSYPGLFRWNRTLKLEGEAFFEVEKGSAFTVDTDYGQVVVLGTKFNVISRDGFFEVVCYDGKVKASNDRFDTVLRVGEAIRFFGTRPDSWKVSAKKPMWLDRESDFRNMPMRYVLGALENQYAQRIEFPPQIGNARFTGTFTHDDLETALRSVCIPMNLKFTRTEPGKIVISE